MSAATTASAPPLRIHSERLGAPECCFKMQHIEEPLGVVWMPGGVVFMAATRPSAEQTQYEARLTHLGGALPDEAEGWRHAGLAASPNLVHGAFYVSFRPAPAGRAA